MTPSTTAIFLHRGIHRGDHPGWINRRRCKRFGNRGGDRRCVFFLRSVFLPCLSWDQMPAADGILIGGVSSRWETLSNAGVE